VGVVLSAAVPLPSALAAGSTSIVWFDAPGLLLRGRPASVKVGTDLEGNAVTPTFEVFARAPGQSGFTRLPLSKGLRAAVPARMLSGAYVETYLLVSYPKSGRSYTQPAAGPKAPYRSWIVDSMPIVRLPSHRFGDTRAPEAVVARAAKGNGPGEVALGCNQFQGICFGPTSFDVAPDGTVWVVDALNDRLLGYPPGHPGTPSRTIPLAFSPIDLAIAPDGGFYLTAHGGQTYNHLVALDASGRRRWTHLILSTIYNANIRIASDGVTYSVDGLTNFRWIPVAGRAGNPLSLAQQQRGMLRYQPLSGDGQLIITYRGDHEQWEGIATAAGTLQRTWRLESVDTMYGRLGSTASVVDGDPVLTFDVPNKANDRLETMVVHLSSSGGLLERFFLARGVTASMDGEVATDTRVGPDGALYQLNSDPARGVRIVRYGLQSTSSTTPTPTSDPTPASTTSPSGSAVSTSSAASPTVISASAPLSRSSPTVWIAVSLGGLLFLIALALAALLRRRGRGG